MKNQSILDQIMASLAFEVEAVPQDNVSGQTSTNKTPLNVKIRLQKTRQNKFLRQGIISIPKIDRTMHSNEKTRRSSSDQTIMSFNVFMEQDESIKKPLRKQKRIFHIFKRGRCLGVESDDEDYEYGNNIQNKTDKGEHSSELMVNPLNNVKEKQNFTLTKNYNTLEASQTRKVVHKDILGKCKPGGCLDPPFNEDKYLYLPKLKTSSTSEKNLVHMKNCKDKPGHISDIKNDNSLCPPERDLLPTQNSNSIITYPSISLSSELIKTERPKNYRNSFKETHSLNDSNGNIETYFISSKKIKLSKEQESIVDGICSKVEQNDESISVKNNSFQAKEGTESTVSNKIKTKNDENIDNILSKEYEHRKFNSGVVLSLIPSKEATDIIHTVTNDNVSLGPVLTSVSNQNSKSTMTKKYSTDLTRANNDLLIEQHTKDISNGTLCHAIDPLHESSSTDLKCKKKNSVLRNYDYKSNILLRTSKAEIPLTNTLPVISDQEKKEKVCKNIEENDAIDSVIPNLKNLNRSQKNDITELTDFPKPEINDLGKTGLNCQTNVTMDFINGQKSEPPVVCDVVNDSLTDENTLDFQTNTFGINDKINNFYDRDSHPDLEVPKSNILKNQEPELYNLNDVMQSKDQDTLDTEVHPESLALSNISASLTEVTKDHSNVNNSQKSSLNVDDIINGSFKLENKGSSQSYIRLAEITLDNNNKTYTLAKDNENSEICTLTSINTNSNFKETEKQSVQETENKQITTAKHELDKTSMDKFKSGEINIQSNNNNRSDIHSKGSSSMSIDQFTPLKNIKTETYTNYTSDLKFLRSGKQSTDKINDVGKVGMSIAETNKITLISDKDDKNEVNPTYNIQLLNSHCSSLTMIESENTIKHNNNEAINFTKMSESENSHIDNLLIIGNGPSTEGLPMNGLNQQRINSLQHKLTVLEDSSETDFKGENVSIVHTNNPLSPKNTLEEDFKSSDQVVVLENSEQERSNFNKNSDDFLLKNVENATEPKNESHSNNIRKVATDDLSLKSIKDEAGVNGTSNILENISHSFETFNVKTNEKASNIKDNIANEFGSDTSHIILKPLESNKIDYVASKTSIQSEMSKMLKMSPNGSDFKGNGKINDDIKSDASIQRKESKMIAAMKRNSTIDEYKNSSKESMKTNAKSNNVKMTSKSNLSLRQLNSLSSFLLKTDNNITATNNNGSPLLFASLNMLQNLPTTPTDYKDMTSENNSSKFYNEVNKIKSNLKESSTNILHRTEIPLKTEIIIVKENEDTQDSEQLPPISNKEDFIHLNIALHSFCNEDNKAFIRTIDDTYADITKRYPNDNILHFKTVIRPNGDEIRIPIDEGKKLSLKITQAREATRKKDSDLQLSTKDLSNTKGIDCSFTNKYRNNDYDNSRTNMQIYFQDKTKSDGNLQEIFNSVYEEKLLPLHNVIKKLKRDVEGLANQKLLIQNKLNECEKKHSQSVPKTVKPCCCLDL